MACRDFQVATEIFGNLVAIESFSVAMATMATAYIEPCK